ncbi:MAG: hypothetical protein MSG64_15665 [Pyrinomonadaceae bacterium MAG19_C2-C3]|nr:hypothetical protein [Pyrinomonadaceae bacterium MAG19_C2-C3]
MNKRQQIIDKVLARMQGIATTAEYAPGKNFETNLGAHVTEWNEEQVERANLPALDVRDFLNSPVQESRSSDGHEHVLTIQFAVIAAAKEQTSFVRACIADIYRAIGIDDSWDSLASKTMPKRDLLKIDQQGQRIAGAIVEINIHFFTASFNPDE